MLPAIGYAIREQSRPILNDPDATAVEICLERTTDRLHVDKHIRRSEFDLVSVHAHRLSVAGPEPTPRDALEALKAIAEEHAATSISDHLGFLYGEESIPPAYTQATLDAACRNIDAIHKFFGRTRFYVENISSRVRPEGTLTESDFLGQVLQKTGCGWLLDVTNVYANARNFGFDPYDFIAEVMPCAMHVQMHLAGGYFDERSQQFVDSHSLPVPDEIWSLYRHALVLRRLHRMRLEPP
jgi:uncharacterized protein (UPF0276 family)